MPKFKKVIRKQVGGNLPYYEEGPGLFQAFENIRSDMAKDIVSPKDAAARAKRMGLAAAAPKIRDLQALSPGVVAGGMAREGIGGAPIGILRQPQSSLSGYDLAGSSISKVLGPAVAAMSAPTQQATRPTGSATPRAARKAASPSVDNQMINSMLMAAARPSAGLSDMPMAPAVADRNAMADYKSGGTQSLAQLSKAIKDAAKAPGASPELAKAAGELPKTKAGMKKFMQEYGKFIALGAMAGAGGKGGQIAAPIIAALPGLIEMLKGRGKKSEAKPTSVQTGMAHGGSMAKKSSGGDTPKKSEGGAIRKFKGGSMNTKDSMFTPKYKKGGDMPKGKATGEMPQHKKMAMGKPTPQSTGQKFAKGGAAKYAGGGMCKGYGIAKKIRPTGPMN
jgi:hypothetical protein